MSDGDDESAAESDGTAGSDESTDATPDTLNDRLDGVEADLNAAGTEADLDDGDEGLSAWLGMFGDRLLGPVPEERRPDVIAGVEDRLRDRLYDDGTWTADYRRLRFVAVWNGTE